MWITRTRRAFVICARSLIQSFGFVQDDGHSPIVIGVSGPSLGGSSPMGESMRNGTRRVVDEIDTTGGVGGREIEPVERDDRAKNETGAKIADGFTQHKVSTSAGIVNACIGQASIDACRTRRYRW